MKDSHLKSMIKAVSWRILGTIGTTLIAFILTHKITIAFYIGIFEFFFKIGLFYFHERIWGMIWLNQKSSSKSI